MESAGGRCLSLAHADAEELWRPLTDRKQPEHAMTKSRADEQRIDALEKITILSQAALPE